MFIRLINKNLYKLFIITSSIIFIISIYVIYISKIIIIDWEFFNILNISFNVSIILDSKGIMFSSIVLFITSNVIKFSILYISEEKFINRFNYLIILFVLSINLLIFIPNIIVLLLGWDGLGIVSFILVIYYQNRKSLSAGLLTILTNRLGDIAIIICIILTINQGHWNLNCIWIIREYKIQCIIILLAAITKRAQLPFSSWLPAAIAAPTPVSALVHSSTLVTAGVFLLIRFYNFIIKFDIFNTLLLYTSLLTTILARICGLLENDIKKIVALSTLSQLGLIITTLRLGILNICFFHIVVHAIFKALLFICVGILINYNSHRQDLRWVGNLTKNIPVTSSCIIISILSISGFPFLSSFYTKDIIIEFCVCNINNIFIYVFIYISIGLTIAYSTRILYNIIFSSINISAFNMISEDINMIKTLILITIPSIISGSLISWLFINNNDHIILRFNEIIIPIIIVIFRFLLSYTLSIKILKFPIFFINFRSNIWFIIILSTQIFINVIIIISKLYLKYIDQSWLEILGGEGCFYETNKISTNILNSLVFNPIKILIWSILSILILLILVYCLSRL